MDLDGPRKGAKGGTASWMRVPAAAVGVAAAVLVPMHWRNERYAARLARDESHTYEVLRGVWTPAELDEIHTAFKRVGESQGIPNGNTYAKGSRWPLVDHIGEAELIRADGTCANRYLVPNNNGTHCIIHHRMDVGLSYIFTGGRSELNHDPESLASRSAVFFLPLFNGEYHQAGGTAATSGDSSMTHAFAAVKDTFPGLEKIFDDPGLEPAVRSVCGPGHEVQGGVFQVAFVVNLPGQQLTTHYDMPIFFGASRFTHPHWLLVAMQASKLWEDRRVHQVQGVAYVHKWNHPTSGAFHMYPSGPGAQPVVVGANSSSALLVDGSACQHGVDLFGAGEGVPPFSRHDNSRILFDPTVDRWYLEAAGARKRAYHTDELRVSFVWRHMCFQSEEEKEGFGDAAEIPISAILDTFDVDLRRRGVLSPGAPRPEPLDFAWMILKEYVNYPTRRNSLIPVNPCVLAAAPVIGSLFRPLC